MKKLTALFTLMVGLSLASVSAEEGKKAEKAKPYPLETCLVSDEKFGGDMGEPYVFVEEGREVKLCCKSCLKDYNKDKKKFTKKMEDAEKAKASKKKTS
ncbi:MAG: hypothetical protein SFY81_16480 [Verrucomicrobiota bacterium]|nr:hypothetical protein [Verrucomicrobiota bacterium]